MAPLIALTATEPDRHGRFPALVMVGGSFIQETLLRDGLAVAFGTTAPLPCFGRFLAAEADARDERRGHWAELAPLPQAFPDALRSRIGRFAIFEGRVRSVGNRPSRSYLNFGDWWAKDVTVEVASDDRELFGGEDGIAGFALQYVRIRGFLEERAGPLMIVRSPTQIEVLEPRK